jgi:hypothetical protein
MAWRAVHELRERCSPGFQRWWHAATVGDEGDAEPRRLLSIKNTARVLGDITTR